MVSLGEARSLPPQPLVAAAVMGCLERGDSDLGGLVALDPALTLAVLRAANAGHLRMSGRVATVDQALVVLGSVAVDAITTATSAATVLAAGQARCVPGGWWLRSLTVAVASATVAEVVGANAREAFTAGMLHDLGPLLEDDAMPVVHDDRVAARLEWALLPERLVRAATHHGRAVEVVGDTLSRMVWAGVRLSDSLIGDTATGPVLAPGRVLGAVGAGAADPDAILEMVVATVRQVLEDVAARR